MGRRREGGEGRVSMHWCTWSEGERLKRRGSMFSPSFAGASSSSTEPLVEASETEESWREGGRGGGDGGKGRKGKK